MAKLTEEMFDPTTTVTDSPFMKLTRNNTIVRGKCMAARVLLFHCLGEQLNTDAEQTSAGEEAMAQTTTPAKRKRQ